MKNVWRIVLLLSLLTCAITLTLGAAQSSEQPEQTYTIDTPYEYPVLPGTQEWIDLGNVVARREASQIPEEILHNMTTDALLLTVLNYPFLDDIYAFNTLEMGYNAVRGHCNGLRELETRPDCLDVLLCYCQETYALEENEKTLQDWKAERIYSVLLHRTIPDIPSYYDTCPTVTANPQKGNIVPMIEGRNFGGACGKIDNIKMGSWRPVASFS